MTKKKTTKRVSVKAKSGYAWLEGAAIGAALGVGAVILARSKTGKDLGKQAKKGGEDFLKYLAPQVKKVKKLGEGEYKELVTKAMERYNADKKLSKTEAQKLVKQAQLSWKNLVKGL